jgi:predicted dehydrogenase
MRWGIIGTGFIANQFAEGLAVLPLAELVAVGSRAAQTANNFADKFNVPHRYDSYQALADDPDVDVVYVSTPHSLHKENSMLCLDAGKAVLCEKPFTINATEAEAVVNLARKNRLFLMEAMWTRYIPLIIKVRQMVVQGVIGELQILVADIGFRPKFDPQSRLFDPNLGGGALLDVGIYPVSMARMFFGSPSRISSMGQFGQTGVDERGAVILGYEGGQMAVMYMSIRNNTPNEAILLGSKGQIRIHNPMNRPTTFTLSRPGRADEVNEVPIDGNGYNYQASEVMRCLQEGQLESPTMPLDESLAIMRTMDEIRTQWGLRYPME